MTHTVRLVTDSVRNRTRAVCACEWQSPWATRGPGWDDAKPRTLAAVSSVAERAAITHIRTMARR